jgi:ribosomal protein L12E/L44/L45/RPP1/RPP2
MVESTDKKDTVVLDIPLLIRVLELAREDIKTDMDLHRVVEKLISIRTKSVLTMDDYNTIANIKENHIAIAMGKMLDDEGSMVLDQMDQLERAITMIRNHIGKDYEKQLPAWVQSKITLATDYVDTVGNYLSTKNEEVVSEVSSELLDRYKEKAKKSADDLSSKGQYKKSTDRWMNVMKATGKQIEKTTANIRKSLHGEEVEEIDEGLKQKLAGLAVAGAMAASAAGHAHAQDSRRITPGETDTRWSHVQQTPAPEKKPEAKKDGPGFSKEYLQQVKDGSHSRPMVSKEKAEELLKKHYNEELSKSARIIKALYRHHRMAEDMYDHEKEDKSVASYGKPPKMATNDPKKNIGDKAQAAAVLTGGKTLTGQNRDTLEIDPIMRKAGPLDQNKKI